MLRADRLKLGLCLCLLLGSCARQRSAPAQAAVTAISATPPVPSYSGSVGQLDAGSAFVDFLEKNANREVQLNITIPDAAFDGSNEPDSTFFVIFDDCGDLPEGEKPVTGQCTGTEININNDEGPSVLKHGNGVWQLSGRYAVGEQTTPLQGLTTIELERKLKP